MAINVSFNGSTIYKPGSYSQEIIDLGGGFPLSPTGLIALFGESSSGTPGSKEVSIAANVFTPDQMPAIIAKYGSGNLVDACNFLFAPGADGAIPAGAQAVYIYKTNASTLSSLVLASNWGTVNSLSWGTAGNLITYQNAAIPASAAMDSSSAAMNLTSSPTLGFALLAASAITNSGASVITGNVGTAPGTAITPGGWTLVGTTHSDDAEAQAAQAAAQAAYTAMEAETPTMISAVLDGQTLVPGVYTETTGTFNLAASATGTLTLNGAGTYIFQCSSTLVTGAGGVPVIALTNGASAANVFWLCGSSATINSGFAGTFQGNVTAMDSISISTAGGTVNGDLVALTAAITIAGATAVNSQPVSAGFGAGDTLVLRVNGGIANTFTMPGLVESKVELLAALNGAGNWSGGFPTGLVFSASGSDAAATLTIAMNVDGNFELISGSLLGSGAGTFNMSAGLFSPETPAQTLITISNYNLNVTESSTIGGTVVLELGRYGADGVNPTVSVTSTMLTLKNNSAVEYNIPLANFNSIAQMVLFINSSTAGLWSAAVGSTVLGQQSPSIMDQVTNVPAASSSSTNFPVQITNNASQVAAFFAQSANVSLTQTAGQGVVGLPPASAETYLSGGSLGGTSSADITNALTQFTKVRVNSVVPLFSRDATADIADGLTDPSSSYTLAGIAQAVKTHLSLMATTKEKSERQGYLSDHDSYANCVALAATMADARIQLVIQDIFQANAAGVIQWFQPWAGACLLAGARGGSPVGNPMTFKYFNMSGIRQTGQPMTTPAQNIVIGFDPATGYDQAIQSGITFWEAPQTGGFRLVVDNTTYGKDGNWVYNRANVLYAADVLAYDFRSQMENIYIGLKNTVTASEIASTASAILNTYLAQGITVSTADAKSGFKQLVVQINGNTVNISVTVKLVEGLDFVLSTITLQRVSQTSG